MDGAITGAAIAKRLASCNETTRHRAIRLFLTWLPQQSDASSSSAPAVSDGDLLKIWKGLFYCVWHSDKLPAQLDLINRLSGLLETLDVSLSTRYFETFIITIRREWSGIDYLRLDKYYLLIRRFLHHFFLLLEKNSWDPNLSAELIGVLREKSLLAVDKCPAQGVNYHIAESFLDEIKEFLPVAVEIVELLLKPFLDVLERSPDKVLVNKIKTSLFGRLAENGAELLNLQKLGDHVELGSEVEKFGNIALTLGLSEKFFNLASASETLQGNRKVLFGLHNCFLKLEKDLEKCGLNISVRHFSNGNAAQKIESLVTDIIENSAMDSVSGDGESVDRPLKKKRKAMKASDDIQKKSKTKKKKKKSPDSSVGTNGDIPMSEIKYVANGEAVTVNGKVTDADDLITFDESLISNLQKQFETVAAEAGIAMPVTVTVPKKRKRVKSADKKATITLNNANGGSPTGKSGEKSAKKVRFSMKNNLVWKPHSPLPPQSLRLPPSTTPRGSALKQGIPPGPVRETPPTVKKIKVKASSLKKGRKSSKSVSPAIKRLRKLQAISL